MTSARVVELDGRTIADAIEYLYYGPDDTGARHNGRRAIRTYAVGRVDYDLTRRELYSYGRHFPLCRYVPRKLNGAADLFVINGDIWRQQGPSRTGDHQAATRRRIELTGARSIILPFSALDGAGIELDSIRPLAVEPDRSVTVSHEARTLAELPRHERRLSYTYTHIRATLDRLPADGRQHYRPAADGEMPAGYGYRDRLPGADGLYRYVETRYRDRAPDADGLYRWTTDAHILGESVFSAVRPFTIERPADPFEHELETARLTVSLSDRPDRRRYCAGADGDTASRRHEAGAAGACIHCGAALIATETVRRRSRYVSSFDTNEAPALYFLAELPRGAAIDSVASAVDCLAPPAVHAARARGRHVARQGDIFLIDTDLTREDLIERGAVFARRTQWTRSARPRKHEATFIERPPARERRRLAALELRYARRLWRERWRTLVEPAGIRAAPATGRRGARQATRARALAVVELENARLALRRATLAGPRAGSFRPYSEYDAATGRYVAMSLADAARRQHAATVMQRRGTLETVAARERAGRLARAAGARDGYRSNYGSNALNLWRQCLAAAARKYRPADIFDSDIAMQRRETVRAAVSIYGTAHAATEAARVSGAVYVFGTVTHEPDLERGRDGGRDHRPLTLTADRWYLAVRNAVPRQTRRRRRRRRAS